GRTSHRRCAAAQGKACRIAGDPAEPKPAVRTHPEDTRRMKKAAVFRLSMAHPGDLSELERLIASGTVRATDVVAVIGKTEGNGGVNDFTRGYFTQTLMALLAKYLNKPAEQLIHEIPCVLSGGTEGVMSPHYSVFCAGEGEPGPGAGPSLAIGTAFSAPVPAEDVGRRAHIDSVAGAVRAAIANAG